jgi:hypothetical protein
MVGEWRKLPNEELYNLRASPGDQIMEDKIGGICSMR